MGNTIKIDCSTRLDRDTIHCYNINQCEYGPGSARKHTGDKQFIMRCSHINDIGIRYLCKNCVYFYGEPLIRLLTAQEIFLIKVLLINQ